jgi:hypothetical protein
LHQDLPVECLWRHLWEVVLDKEFDELKEIQDLIVISICVVVNLISLSVQISKLGFIDFRWISSTEMEESDKILIHLSCTVGVIIPLSDKRWPFRHVSGVVHWLFRFVMLSFFWGMLSSNGIIVVIEFFSRNFIVWRSSLSFVLLVVGRSISKSEAKISVHFVGGDVVFIFDVKSIHVNPSGKLFSSE